jgi:hypothetical protein
VGSNYLVSQPPVYGLTYPLPAGLGEQASALLDAYLKREEGLVYATDASGAPIYMTALTPKLTFTLGGAIAPGTNVAATVAPALVRPDMVGEVLVIDAGSSGPSGVQEACVVAATNGANQVTLAAVKYAHLSGATAETGLVIQEDRNLPSKRSIARIAKWPIVNVLGLLGRYAYGRRSDQVGGLYQEMNLLASVQTFGGPPQWIPVSTAQCSWSDQTGEIWVPAGMLMAYYSDVRVAYVAGYQAGAVPDPIVRAAGSVAVALQTTLGVGLAGQISAVAPGSVQIERFFASNVDEDALRAIEPFKARTMF